MPTAVMRTRLAGMLGVAACTFALFRCAWFQKSQIDCVTDAAPACSETWCNEQLASACDKKTRLCGEPIPGECNNLVCVQTYGERIRHLKDVQTVIGNFDACIRHVSDCPGVKACFAQIDPGCPVDDGTASSIGTVLPTRLDTPGSQTPGGVVVLPGDDLVCMQCALAKGGCAGQVPECFTVLSADAGRSDTCLDYRVCLRMCQQSTMDDGKRFYVCARTQCDTPEHSHGKASFEQFRQCMVEKCSSCFVRQP